jgi:hypothetical protein
MTSVLAPGPHLTIIDRSCQNQMALALRRAFDYTLEGRTQLTRPLFAVPGFSGRKFRIFLNNLLATVTDPRYLEIGVLSGASFITAIYRNRVKGTAIDNWSWPGGDIDRFKAYLTEFGADSDVAVLNTDFRTVDFAGLPAHNVLFYDGSHAEEDQLDGVRLPSQAMDPSFIAIVDDWNWEHVRRGTFAGLSQAGCRIDYMIEVRTTLDNRRGVPESHGPASDWHNGMFAAVVTRA